ncbi:hypothetical protein [Azospirillum halopraeferens]|uniref:hypothetical protein n=1 Tax=Azospirillum halopraeferens TaxID=34010 RepID=UPI00041FEB2E|nr:hypothetical protein [Azospirillum halopraeferens]
MDAWPAAVWIVAGVLGFTAAPWAYATWKGIAFFVLGTPPLLLLAGTAVHRFHRTVAAMLTEVFPGGGTIAGFVGAVIRAMLRLVEAVLILSLARGALVMMQAGPGAG